MPGRAENQGREARLQRACRLRQGAMHEHCRQDWCFGGLGIRKKPSADWERNPTMEKLLSVLDMGGEPLS